MTENSANNANDEQVQPADEQNKALMDRLGTTQDAGAKAIRELRGMLKSTYWVVIWLSIIMFSLGVLLLLVPIVHAIMQLGGNTSAGQDWTLSAITGGMGLADIVTLFLFQPVERIRKLMGDFSQLTVILNTYQTRVGLRLLESKLEDRPTVGQAAVNVSIAAKDCLDRINDYFENETGPNSNSADDVNSGTAPAQAATQGVTSARSGVVRLNEANRRV